MLSLAIALGLCVPATQTGPPRASIALAPRMPSFTVTLELTTASRTRYSVTCNLTGELTELARDELFRQLVLANWLVEKDGHFGVHIYGVRTPDHKGDAATELVVVARPFDGREFVRFNRSQGVKLDRQQEARPQPKPRTGPDLGAERFVEFDFAPVPCERGKWTLRLKASTDKVFLSEPIETTVPTERQVLCGSIVEALLDCGFKAELVKESKIRIYGQAKAGTFYPMTHGSADSDDLREEELPRVKNPEKK